VIGEGGFGQVFLVRDKKGNAPLALKKILISLNGQYMTDQKRLRVMRET
jgi:serine/threonine protein kinase